MNRLLTFPFAAAALALSLAGCVGDGATPSREVWSGASVDNRTNFAGRLLEAHNRERQRLGLVPLKWNAALASHARAYAESLAARDAFEHSAPDTRPGEGENLWKGTAGAYSLEEMIGHFIAERADFKPGLMPNVAKDGNWEAVAHYTQIIWPTSREVGCGLARAHGTDWLVCRYAPRGNIVGQKVG